MTAIEQDRSHAHETLVINPVEVMEPAESEPRTPPVLTPRPAYQIRDVNPAALVVSSFLPGDVPLHSDLFPVMGVECVAEFSYWAGLASQWDPDNGRTLINVEQDMEFSDELVAELVDCEHPLCAYPYQVYPRSLGRYIYCATTTQPDLDGHPRDPRWVEPGDEWAVWSSIGFAKIAPAARIRPLDKLFWQWLEHGVNRVVNKHAGLRWHLHWPEIRHLHDYETVPDHLW